MSDQPDPLAPEDCDLRGYDFMPLLGNKLFNSDLYLSRSAEEFRCAVRLWWAAWHQRPAGSLPSSDAALAMLADFGRDLKGWLKVKEGALHGFVTCSDGRLYHPVLCEEAIKAYALRLRNDAKRDADKERLQRWRDTKKKRTSPDDGNADETRFETPDETGGETPSVAVDSTTQHNTEDTPLRGVGASLPEQPPVKARRAKPRSGVPDDWQPDQAGRVYAEERDVNVPHELQAFRNHHEGRGNLMADWSAAWRTWCDNYVKFGKARQASGKPSHRLEGWEGFAAQTDLERAAAGRAA